jgi:phospholipid/cholesterol/gamma-HCH transport system substrate-binding protein
VSTSAGTGATGNGRSPEPPDGAGSDDPTRAHDPRLSRASMAVRVVASAALVAVLIVVLVLVFANSSGYVVHADFQDASGLVTGDNVLLGPAAVGTVKSISLTGDGQANIALSLHGTGTLHRGTVARIQEDSLSGIASKYVSLQPGPVTAPALTGGATIGSADTYSEVNIDELFDTFNPATRTGLSNLIRGEATSLRGKGQLANRTLEYLAPGLESTSDVTHELARDEPAFDGLIVKGAEAMKALAARSSQLSQLIANTSTATGAIDRQSQALQTALALAPATLTRSTRTFAGLDTTLDSLDPVVAAAKPASRRLPQFLAGLRSVSAEAIPTIAALNDLISDPNGGGDLTTLAQSAPGLVTQADRAFPELVHNFNESRGQIDYLREYTPDVVAALTNVGQASSYYDANGHYARTAPVLYPFTTDAMGQLVQQNPADRYDGLQHVSTRCPGSAAQASSDGSSPVAVAGCDTKNVPSGP